MALVFQEAWSVIKTLHGQIVSLNYGEGTITDLRVVKTRPGAQAAQGEDVYVESYSWDFLIEPADLVVNGVQIIPEEGFQITEQDGTIYRLIPGDSNNLIYRYSDQYKTWIRVFAEQITNV
jgi:hypothetical protein